MRKIMMQQLRTKRNYYKDISLDIPKLDNSNMKDLAKRHDVLQDKSKFQDIIKKAADL